jgi:uncharacterized membrane protein
MLHHIIEIVLPIIISILEIMGIFVVVWTAIHAFWEYIQNSFMKKNIDIQSNLAGGLATGLEFKLAAEILKTVLIQSMDELYILGAVILLRALMSVLIHFEMKGSQHGKKKEEVKNEEEKSDSTDSLTEA